MKWNRSFILATVPLLALALLAPAKTQGECSNATLKGSYGFTLSGFLLDHPGVPLLGGTLAFAESGVRTFDGAGNFSDSHTVASLAGTIFQPAATGTYSVNSDCTGSMNVGTSLTEDFTIVNGGQEVEFIVSTPGRVMLGSLKKQ